jgi:hypothetical protein
MKKLLAFATAALAVLSVYAIEREENKLVFSEEEMSRCKSEGGCQVVTKHYLESIQKEAEGCLRNRT